jgi:hypothetical protein
MTPPTAAGTPIKITEAASTTANATAIQIKMLRQSLPATRALPVDALGDPAAE